MAEDLSSDMSSKSPDKSGEKEEAQRAKEEEKREELEEKAEAEAKDLSSESPDKSGEKEEEKKEKAKAEGKKEITKEEEEKKKKGKETKAEEKPKEERKKEEVEAKDLSSLAPGPGRAGRAGGQAEAEAKEEEKGERKWYVVQTFSGQEDKVKESITRNVENMNMQHKVFKVLVPEEETVEIKGGKRIEKVKKMFPGYVFIEMILDDESWYVIRGTPGVAKFIGTKVKPTPVSDKEMQRVLKQIGIKEEKLEAAFEVGESVRIISGPFRGYTGTVDEVNVQKGKLKTLINIFGRDTPVEVSFEQVQKIT